MKQKILKFKGQYGFTVVELLVVLSIMVIIATVVILDFSRQRAVRNIVLAKNETVTNIRKVQSYMLSSRNISEGVAAKFYIVKFEETSDPASLGSYTIQAVDGNYELHDNIETVKLPSGVTFSEFRIEGIGKGADPVPYSCLEIIFSAPFGNMYTNGSESCNGSIAEVLRDPVRIAEMSQRKAYLVFDTKAQDTAIVVNPITGQITSETIEGPSKF